MEKKLEWLGVSSFYLGIASYLFLREWLAFPIAGFLLALIGLIRFNTEKHKAKWYAAVAVFVNLVSFLLGVRDNYM